jgi:hypothetical protein
MDVSFKIRENRDISWLENTYGRLNSKESFNERDIDLYKELLGGINYDTRREETHC